MRILLALALLLALAGCGGAACSPAPETHPEQAEAAAPERTVVVHRAAQALPAETDTFVPVTFEGGTLPAAPVTATVLTDTSCEADAQGVSHCLNTLELADGSSLVVRHHHVMAEFPCLAPGEQVALKLA